MAGGYNVFGTKAIAKKTFNLSGHKSLRLKVQLWKIDSWDYEELFIQVDGQIVWSKHYGWYDIGLPQCGAGHTNWDELAINVDIIIPHTSATATVLISSTID